jgi:hypothetical protein
MGECSVIEFTVLIPTERNSDRKEHCFTAWDHFEGRLFDLFGGFTNAGEVTGHWADQHGNVVKDKSRQYKIAVEHDKEKVMWQLLEESKRQFDQVCIYAAITSRCAYLV